MKSLKSRLLKKSFFIISTTIALILTLAFYSTKDEVSDLHNLQLEQSAKYLLNFANQQNYNLNNIDSAEYKTKTEHNFEEKRSYRLWQDGVMVSQSSSAKKLADINTPFGYSKQNIDEYNQWHFFKSHDLNNNVVIEIGEDNSIRQEILREILLSFIIPTVLLIPLLLLMIYYSSTFALKPLMELSKIMYRKKANDFTQVTLKNNFLEVQPVTKSINKLLEKIEISFEKERSFTDHAAHQLRTPLAVLKAQNQAIMQQHNIAELKDLQLGIDRMENMVSQLLAFSRLQNKKIATAEFNLSNTVTNILKQISILAINKNIELEIEIEDNIIINADEFGISLAISNLIDNAIKYSEEKSSISIKLTKKDDICLIIADNGIGLDENDQKNLFQKFYRNKKQTNIGSGLGLAIVKLVCDLNNITIKNTQNKPKGTVFSLIFNQ